VPPGRGRVRPAELRGRLGRDDHRVDGGGLLQPLERVLVLVVRRLLVLLVIVTLVLVIVALVLWGLAR
jgi:hypothetical protein